MLPQYRSIKLSKEETERILDLEENWAMDKKGRDIAPNKISNTVSAFANTNGGEIYVGISHDESQTTYYWDGFPTMENYNQIIDIVTDICPGYEDCSFEYYVCDTYDTVILHITIQKTRRVIYATNGIPYLRMGVQNIPQKLPERIRQLEYDKGIFSYEDELTGCVFDDIKNSFVLRNFIQQIVPHTNSYDWLKSQYLMNSEMRITAAGVLLYSENPQAALPKRSGIRILRYHSDSKEGTREALDDGFPLSIEGDLYSLITKAVNTTIQIVEETDVIGQEGLVTKKYPDVTLHEIITNAVLHRDYSIATDIQIRIYTNRIEIESPGRLPGHITTENILREQCSRNGKIVRLISRFPSPPNKDVGEGLNTAFDAMTKMDLKKPIIKEKENSVLVIIKHERLADHEIAVLEYLKNHNSISNAQGREITGLTDTIKMKDVFARLRDQEVLEKVPGKKGSATRWRLSASQKQYVHSRTDMKQKEECEATVGEQIKWNL